MILNFRKFYTKFPWNFPGIFGNCSQNLPEILTIFHNSYKFHSQNFYILRKNFINGADKNRIITFWCISRKRLVCFYWIPNLRIWWRTLVLVICSSFPLCLFYCFLLHLFIMVHISDLVPVCFNVILKTFLSKINPLTTLSGGCISQQLHTPELLGIIFICLIR